MLAGTAVYVNAGTQLGQLEGPGGILSLDLLLSFALLGVFPLLARWLLPPVQSGEQAALRVPVGDSVVEMILDLVRAFRPEDPLAGDSVRDTVSWGPGPRAAQALMMTVRARALLEGRLAPAPEDVLNMARPVLTHRMALTFSARARGEVLGRLIDEVAHGMMAAEAAA